MIDKAPHVDMIIRAVFLGHRNAEARTGPEAEEKKQKLYTAGTPYGSQSLGPQEPPYNDSVGQVIKLLQQVSHQQGKGKCQNQFQGIPLCHIIHTDRVSFRIFGSS